MVRTAALLLCLIVTVVLLATERRRNRDASFALWLPTLWTAIIASRPVARWFLDFAETDYSAGSLPDQIVLMSLIVLSIVVVGRRNVDWKALFVDNRWLILLFLFAGLSVIWSDVPFVSTKRWVRAFGTLVVGLVILTESDPLKALESIFRRTAYLLIPLSYVLIKYFPEFGRAYGRWDGIEMWLGVATHKNGLAQLCAISIIFLVWSFVSECRNGHLRKAGIGVIADLAIVVLATYLLLGPGAGAYSATSISVVLLSGVLLVALQGKGLQRVALSSIVILLAIVIYLAFYDDVIAFASSLLGRNTTLTGRTTDIWPVVLEAAYQHPVLGSGYGGVWGLGGEVSQAVEVEQAHNGYLDVFLQLGAVGMLMLCAYLLEFARNLRRLVGVAGHWPILGACTLFSLLAYNNSESTFLEYPSYLWTMAVLLSMVAAAWHRKFAVPAQSRAAKGARQRLWRDAEFSRDARRSAGTVNAMAKEI